MFVRTLLHYGDSLVGSEHLMGDHELGHEHDSFEAEYAKTLNQGEKEGA